MKVAAHLIAHMRGNVRHETVYTKDGLADRADRIMAELVSLGVEDPNVSVDFEAGVVDMSFSIDVDTDDQVEGSYQALSMFRTAIHAAGGSTPGWESLEWQTELAEPNLIDAQP